MAEAGGLVIDMFFFARYNEVIIVSERCESTVFESVVLAMISNHPSKN